MENNGIIIYTNIYIQHNKWYNNTKLMNVQHTELVDPTITLILKDIESTRNLPRHRKTIQETSSNIQLCLVVGTDLVQ